jgi:hypothetical protein
MIAVHSHRSSIYVPIKSGEVFPKHANMSGGLCAPADSYLAGLPLS